MFDLLITDKVPEPKAPAPPCAPTPESEAPC